MDQTTAMSLSLLVLAAGFAWITSRNRAAAHGRFYVLPTALAAAMLFVAALDVFLGNPLAALIDVAAAGVMGHAAWRLRPTSSPHGGRA